MGGHHHSPPPPSYLGDVKKTFPMKRKVFFTGDRHTNTQTDGHHNSMTESAQWADSVKINIRLDGPKLSVVERSSIMGKEQYCLRTNRIFP